MTRFATIMEGPDTAPPVLLLHGFLGSAADFAPTMAALVPAFRCIAVDLPGHGGTVAQDAADFTMEGTAAALLGWLSQAGVGRPHLVGYSMGGRLALHLAATARSRFATVVAVSASPGLADPEERAARRQSDAALAQRLRTEPLGRFLADWYAQPLFAPLAADPARLAEMLARRAAQDPEGLARSLEGIGTGAMAPLWGALPDLPGPVHALAGARDAKFAAIAARMADAPGISARLIPDAGHAPHLEQPARFVQTLRDVLRAP